MLKRLLLPLLSPPGEGVYTVHTARDRKLKMQNYLYPGKTQEEIEHFWQSQFYHPPGGEVMLLGVPSDVGGGILRGANWGPLFIREALYEEGVPDCLWDLGDIRVVPHAMMDEYLSKDVMHACREALYGKQNVVHPVAPLSMTMKAAQVLYEHFPERCLLGLGGDHSVSYPLVTAAARAQAKLGKRMGVIHFDAHTDLLEQRLGFDICFGSWAYHCLKELESPADLVQIGLRASGQPQEHWEERYGVKQFWAQTVLGQPIHDSIGQILSHLESQCIDTLYISFDVDVIDAGELSATGTPEPEGLMPSHTLDLINAILEKYPLVGADIVEVAPFVHHPDLSEHQEPAATLGIVKRVARALLKA